MFRYHLWALAEKTLSVTPGGRKLYESVGKAVRRQSQGSGPQIVTSIPTVKKVRELLGTTGVAMEVGTGWFHHDAFLLHLVGDYEVVLFDVVDKARLEYIQNYLRNLLQHSGFIARELNVDEGPVRAELETLLRLPSREAIYDHCGFSLCITTETNHPFLPERSVDCMVSNCTLVHIPPQILVPELKSLRSMLKDDGFMYHHLGHDDHWALHDPSMAWPSFHYMRFSERVWSLVYTSLEYHNRLVKPEWMEIFVRCGLEIVEYGVYSTEDSRRAIAQMPKIDKRFSRHEPDDLAVIYSYVLLRREDEAGGSKQRPDGLTVEVEIPWLDHSKKE